MWNTSIIKVPCAVLVKEEKQLLTKAGVSAFHHQSGAKQLNIKQLTNWANILKEQVTWQLKTSLCHFKKYMLSSPTQIKTEMEKRQTYLRCAGTDECFTSWWHLASHK